MQLGMIGLGRMGSNMVRRLLRANHECVVYDRSARSIQELANHGATAARSLATLAAQLHPPRAIWLMLPAASVDHVIQDLVPFLDENDVLIDGGNSFYQDDIRRFESLRTAGIHYLDVGTSGGIWGLEKGYCLMIGGHDAAVVQRLEPIFAALAPGRSGKTLAQAAKGQRGNGGARRTAEEGYLHCGPAGAGHFVKMVHNGIEYGLMAAYAEGFNILHHANVGKMYREHDSETTPLQNPAHYQYDFDLPDIAELWRHGSVIRSWLLELLAETLKKSPELKGFYGNVADSGEGRWTIHAALDEGVPTPVLSSALFARFSSRGEATFADQILSALRLAFGGHLERQTSQHGEA